MRKHVIVKLLKNGFVSSQGKLDGDDFNQCVQTLSVQLGPISLRIQ